MAQIPSGPDRRRPNMPDAAQYAGLGVTFAGGIVLFTLLGVWVDGRLGTSPWGVLLGVFLGFGLSLAWIYRKLVIGPRQRGDG
ncbi:MAG TPA: AtpZ/AtpI family protein [Longimicrobium sp.]|jgi:F0F1-type ATP synthase assembly protein I